jgi:hypothetical protein
VRKKVGTRRKRKKEILGRLQSIAEFTIKEKKRRKPILTVL